MARKKTTKKVAKPKAKITKKPIAKPKEDLKAIAKKRDALIAVIKPKLLSKEAMKRGGSQIRVRYAQEQGYLADIDEINKLGKKLGCAPIGLGHLRK